VVVEVLVVVVVAMMMTLFREALVKITDAEVTCDVWRVTRL